MKKFYITRDVAVTSILTVIEMLYDNSDKMDFITKFMTIMLKPNNNGVFIENILGDKIIKLLRARCFCKKNTDPKLLQDLLSSGGYIHNYLDKYDMTLNDIKIIVIEELEN